MAVESLESPIRLNEHLVDALVADDWLRSPHVEAAFRSVLRHHFLPSTPLEDVYSGNAIVTLRGPDGMATSSSSDPRIMARMLEQLEVQAGHQVLEIGAGTGYNAALLSRLSGEDGRVTTVDIDPMVTAAAADHLRRAGHSEVDVITGDGWAGVPSTAPFDRIEATVGVWDLAPSWLDQLRTGGILTVPLWLRGGLQASVAFRKSEVGLHSRSVEPCAFMRLQGLGAGPETYTRVGRWMANFDRPRPTDVAVLNLLLERPPRSQEPPPLAAGWFTGIALTAPDAIMLADWESKVALSGLFDSAGPGLAVVESDVRGSEQLPRALHAFGAGEASARLMTLIEETPAVGLDEVEIHMIPREARWDHTGILARLSRPHAQFLITVSEGAGTRQSTSEPI